ncbi:MAG: hypothetical protein A2X18_08245 [Bacteroidetes bacterium GWF2_40_14]|nr:MAG: hypothetical protein A2X18_08245 [Bacteroidetes bacterium GWF2_40_14]
MIEINVKQELTLKIFANKYLFEQWMRQIFYLNDSLNKEYDTIYQNQYYILIYNLLTEGKTYTEETIESINGCKNHYLIKFYDRLYKAILELKSILKDDEYNYLEYRRHGSCHIFQDSYEIIQDNGKIKEKRKNVNIFELKQDLQDVIARYNGDKGFDIYLTKTFYPILCTLYAELTSIHLEEKKNGVVQNFL